VRRGIDSGRARPDGSAATPITSEDPMEAFLPPVARPRRPMALTPDLVSRAFRVEPEIPPEAHFTPLGDDAFAELADGLLDGPRSAPVWVFAYGSLIWKPVFAPDAVRRGIAHGWHRAFTLRIERFRGTPEHPGLMMALAPGGRCRCSTTIGPVVPHLKVMSVVLRK
jgi:cation transport protein ChaC